MNRWFRVYDDLVDDPKVQKLAPELFKALVNIWCLASKNDGRLPGVEDIAFKLRMKVEKVKQIVASLHDAGLIDTDETGLCPHNWSGRQFLSDNSAERVKRHRARRKEAGLKSQWQAPKELRIAVYTRDNFQCVYCGSEESLSLDHKTPEIRGGTHDIDNLQTACISCNGGKRDMTHDEFVTRNRNVTLPKRPQSTEAEEDTERKKDAASPPPMNDETEVFRRGKQVLGEKSGGMITKLITAKNGSIPHARAAIEIASTKHDPREYIGGIIRGTGPPDARARGDAW